MDTIGMILLFVVFAVVAFTIVGYWKVFEKAGQPGWAIFVPFYNYYIMTKIAGKPGWWTVLCCIPYVNFIFIIILTIAMVKKFGKSTAYGLGMVFLSPIFIPMLGFGDAQYEGAEGLSNEDLLDA